MGAQQGWPKLLDEYTVGDDEASVRQAKARLITSEILAHPFDQLNETQREAVEHGLGADTPRSGALLIVAGAGTGKTNTLCARVARLVMSGADPRRILLLTFSRRAASEMSRRASSMLRGALRLPEGHGANLLPWCGTFHAIGARLLREEAPRVGLPPDFTVLDRADAEDLMGLVRQTLGLSATRRRIPVKDTCLAIYSRVVNSQASLKDVLAESFPWCAPCEPDLRSLFGAYVAEKQQQHVVDYDDLLHWWAELMGEPALAERARARFDHVLVDEYQDTNRLQARIVHALKPDGHGLTVVGDDAQAIYSFRAAEVQNMLQFPAQFSRPVRVLTLEHNYRSTGPILKASNALMSQAGERFTKNLWTDRTSSERPLLVAVEDDMTQASWVAERVLEHREQGIRLRAQAVLFRTAHHSAALELELARRNIPFVKFGGLKFLESTHVKDVLSVLRWAQNIRCRLAGFRVAQLVPGIGPTRAGRLMNILQAADAPVEALAAFAPPGPALEDWRLLLALLGRLRHVSAVNAWPGELDAVTQWYQPHLERLHEDARVRLADLVQLQHMASGFGTREQFLTELALDPPAASSDESGPAHLDEDYLVLSTIHSAKGQEWQSVHVLNVVDGCIPSDMSTGSAAQVEEERRLLYVAMTRARHHLHLLVPQRFYTTQQAGWGDRHVYATLSRFIPAPVAEAFDWVRPSARQTPADGEMDALNLPTVDLASKVRRAW